MNIYDETTATAGGEFTDGDPLADPVVPRTVLRSIWTNMIQRELINLVEGAGLTLDANDDAQVLEAINDLDTAVFDALTTNIATAKSEAIAAADAALIARRHTSAEKTIAANTQVSSAHSLGAVPFQFDVFLRCKTAEHGYVAGQMLRANIAFKNDGTANANPAGFQAWVDATNVYAVPGDTLPILTTAGAYAVITPANWRIVLIANK